MCMVKRYDLKKEKKIYDKCWRIVLRRCYDTHFLLARKVHGNMSDSLSATGDENVIRKMSKLLDLLKKRISEVVHPEDTGW